MGKLIVNVGGMFSGKTTALIQQGERYILAKRKVVYVKPEIDNRYSEDSIVTHKGQGVEAISMPTEGLSAKVFNFDVILIDEVQFFDGRIVSEIEYLLQLGKTVIVSGLDMDFQGEGFEVTMKLMAKADVVNKYKAVCEECGEDATFSYRKNTSKEKVVLGEKDTYKPLCRKCYYNKQKN